MNSSPTNPKHGINGSKKDMDKHSNSTRMKFPGGMEEMSRNQMLNRYWWGGGEPGSRSIFCCYGYAAESSYEDMPKNKLTVWLESNPIKYNFAWAEKQDVILFKSGFAPSRWTKDLVRLLDKAGAKRIINWEQDRLNTTFLQEIEIED
jgi:hypothetical protein